MKEHLSRERTLVLIKPDGARRGLIGIILQRFEQSGFMIIACKFILASTRQIRGHFPESREWEKLLGQKVLEAADNFGIDPYALFGTADPVAVGQIIKEWNCQHLASGPVMVLVLEGIHAVDAVRKIVGSTMPYKALPGTIRGDFSIDSPDLACLQKRALHNIIHASDTLEEACREISNWFSQSEIVKQERGG